MTIARQLLEQHSHFIPEDDLDLFGDIIGAEQEAMMECAFREEAGLDRIDLGRAAF